MIKAEISTRTINSNIKLLKSKLGKGVKVCAVLKANAYSLGASRIGTAIESAVDWYAVATITEAIELRTAGVKKPILLFGRCADFNMAARHQITASINSESDARRLADTVKTTQKCAVHIKVNTGLNRYGITTLPQLWKIIALLSAHKNITVTGIYTHFASSTDTDLQGVRNDIARFIPFKTVIKRHFPDAIIHAACSNNFDFPSAQFDMVRVGKLLYGGQVGFHTALHVTSVIAQVQQIPRGASVGYDKTFIAQVPMTVAVVPCGYADLAHFRFADTQSVQVGKVLCPIIGKVCMDCFMIDASKVKNPLGKTVTIISKNKGQTLMDICAQCGIIACDLLCSFNFTRAKLSYK